MKLKKKKLQIPRGPQLKQFEPWNNIDKFDKNVIDASRKIFDDFTPTQKRELIYNITKKRGIIENDPDLHTLT